MNYALMMAKEWKLGPYKESGDLVRETSERGDCTLLHPHPALTGLQSTGKQKTAQNSEVPSTDQNYVFCPECKTIADGPIHCCWKHISTAERIQLTVEDLKQMELI